MYQEQHETFSAEPPPPRSNRALIVIAAVAIAAIGLIVCCIGAFGLAYWQTNGFEAWLSAPTETPTRAARPIATTTRIASTEPTTLAQTTPTPGQKPKVEPTPNKPTPTPPPVPKAKPLKMNSPEYGIQAFLWWRNETAARDNNMLLYGGFSWVKQGFAWRDLESAGKGKFDWSRADNVVYLANANNVDILARVDNAPEWAAPGCFSVEKKSMGPARNQQDWVDFLTAFVTRYKGRIRAYEIWNEPNLSREWCNRPPNPTEYVALLKISYQTIKAIDPNAMIISAGLTPTTASNDEAMPDAVFVQKMYDAMRNNSTGYFDVLGIHAPGFKAPPEMSPDDVAKNPAYNNGEQGTGRIYAFRHAEDIRKIMVERGDSNKQIAILEFGWTSDPIHPAYSWFRVDEQTKAKYIVGAYQYAKKNWSPWIGAMFLIYLSNPDWTKDYEEYWWAITEPNGDPRPAALELKKMPK